MSTILSQSVDDMSILIESKWGQAPIKMNT